tara:strand:+ start:11218 stop:11787 length:570 start_codon:yes stop_codon:yes gene_type:complete
MSSIFVDSIKDKSNTKTLATLSNTATTLHSDVVFPAGHIIQIVQTAKTDTTSFNTSDSWDDIAGITVAITPSATSSKILVSYSLNVGGATSQKMFFKLLRGSTDIAIGDTAGSKNRATTHARINQNQEIINVNGQFLDSPSTTSATTYKVQWYRPTDLGAIYLNMAYGEADSADYMRSSSTITVMEVSG